MFSPAVSGESLAARGGEWYRSAPATGPVAAARRHVPAGPDHEESDLLDRGETVTSLRGASEQPEAVVPVDGGNHRRLDDYLGHLEDIFDNIEGMLACKDLDTLEWQVAKVYGYLLKMAASALGALAGDFRERSAVDEALLRRATFVERRGLTAEVRDRAGRELADHDLLGEEVREPWAGLLERFEREGYRPLLVPPGPWLPRTVREGDLSHEVEAFFESIERVAVIPVSLRGRRPEDPGRLDRDLLHGLEVLYLAAGTCQEESLQRNLRRMQKVAEVVVTNRASMEELLKKMATFRHQTKGKNLQIHGSSLVVQAARQRIEALARASVRRLRMQGPRGAGKKHVAELFHRLGAGASNPFVAVDCARINIGRDPHHPSDYAFRQRLFGDAHARGLEEAMGAFEEARGGTLFLDEVEQIPQSFQYKLARIFQEGRFNRPGEEGHVKIDCTVILASEADLEEAAAERRFSSKLLRPFRAQGKIRIPGLNERREDIPDLVETFFASQVRSQKKHRLTRVAPETMRLLTERDWTDGNVKALKNLIGWMVARASAEDAELLPRHLPDHDPDHDARPVVRGRARWWRGGSLDIDLEELEDSSDEFVFPGGVSRG